MDKYESITARKINIPYHLITNREDWENFVDFCSTNKDLNRRKTDFKAAMFVDTHGSKTENDPGSSSISDIKTVYGRDARVQNNRSAPHT